MSLRRACALSDLTEATALHVEFDEVDVAIVRIGEDIYAIEDVCSHGDFQLSIGEVDASNCSIECPLHGAHFDLRTGRFLTPPATRGVPIFPVRVRGDEVYVGIGGVDDDEVASDELTSNGLGNEELENA